MDDASCVQVHAAPDSHSHRLQPRLSLPSRFLLSVGLLQAMVPLAFGADSHELHLTGGRWHGHWEGGFR